MPTQPLLPYHDGPEGLASTVDAQVEKVDLTMSIKSTNTILHKNHQDKYLMLTAGCMPMDCMFCDQTFKQHDEFGKHVLTQHRPTLCEPTVLCVEAEYLSPLEKNEAKRSTSIKEDVTGNDDCFNCKVCGQAFHDTMALETHMKKHKDSFTYRCDICGRRFKEPWFLKNHRRTHIGKAGAKHKSQHVSESPVTINDVVQECVARNITTTYKMCMVCGFMFPNKDSLMEHSKIHSKGPVYTEDKQKGLNAADEEKPSDRDAFLNCLSLGPRICENGTQSEKCAKWIRELDPFNTYQAWQLATRGKVAVGHGQVKEPGQEGSTDNDDSCSDKEELSEIWIEENGCPVLHLEHTGRLKSNKSSNSPETNLFGDKEKIRPASGETSSVEGEQKSTQSADKPTHCLDCGKAFRTYHQLVLHSRVHKKERKHYSEYPTTVTAPTATTPEGKRPMTGSPNPIITFENHGIGDQTDSIPTLEDNGIVKCEDGSEDGSEDGLGLHSEDKSEDGSERGKIKSIGCSKECSYCGKSFRSNYYLNIHLRTHTGEKPYKCEFCDYAAAQKTSLRYHLDRRHKDKPIDTIKEVKCENGELYLEEDSHHASSDANKNHETTKNFKALLHGAKEGNEYPLAKRQKCISPVEDSVTLATSIVKREGPNAKSPSPDIDSSLLCKEENKFERVENFLPCAVKPDDSLDCPLNQEDLKRKILVDLNSVDPLQSLRSNQRNNAYAQELPLNLCIRSGENGSGITLTRSHLSVSTCPFCTYKTFYPEVLLMHQKLMHKYNPPETGKRLFKSKTASHKMRRTGCPPSLLGKDVPPLFLDVLKSKSSMVVNSKSLQIERAKPPKSLQYSIPPVLGQELNKRSDANKSDRLQQNDASQMVIYHQEADLYNRASIPMPDRMQRTDMKVKTMNVPFPNVYSKVTGHVEYPFENRPSWFGNRSLEYDYNRTLDNINLEFGEPSSKRGKPCAVSHDRINSDMSVYGRGLEMGRMHIPPTSGLQHDSLSTKNGSKPGMITTNAVDPRWNVFMKQYEAHNPGPLYSSYGTSSSPMYRSAVEGKMTIAYEHLSNRMLQKRNFECLISKAHYGANDKNK